MLNNLVTLFSNSITTTKAAQTSSTTAVAAPKTSKNPFAGDNNNPFLSSTFTGNEYYGKNTPVTGGYFAGYYNGKPNIVGSRLFLEV